MRKIHVALACKLLLCVLVSPLRADAQQAGKIPSFGLLVTGPPLAEHACVIAFRRGMTDLGYVEGRTHVVEARWAEGDPKPALATVPVVMAASNYPVERGLVQSLSRAGGNITGIATFTSGTFEK
jgi:putative tryptophan/tyrosine transport system substrate-binding protein